MSFKKVIEEFYQSGKELSFWLSNRKKVTGKVADVGSFAFVMKSGNSEKLFEYKDIALLCGIDESAPPKRVFPNRKKG